MKLIDLSNPRHQQILIEEIARAKRIIAETQTPLQESYNIKVGDLVVIKPPKRKTAYRGTVVKTNTDGTFDWKDNKGEVWSGSDIQVVSVNGAPPQQKTSDGDDNNNGYPDSTENPLHDDDGMFVTKGFTELNISAEDRDAFLAGESVPATDSDGEEYEINRNMADINWSDTGKSNPASAKKTYTGQEILSHPEFVNLPETRGDVDWQNRPQVYLPAVDNASARIQIFAKSDLLGSEVQGPKMVHRFAGYLKEFESKFGESPIFIDVDHKYLGKIIDIQNPKFIAWREAGLKAYGAAMDAARKRGRYGHD